MHHFMWHVYFPLMLIANQRQVATCVPREEANEEAKLRTIVALGAWMQLLEKVPEAAISRLSDSFKEKDNLRRAQLRVLNNVSTWPAPVSHDLS